MAMFHHDSMNTKIPILEASRFKKNGGRYPVRGIGFLFFSVDKRPIDSMNFNEAYMFLESSGQHCYSVDFLSNFHFGSRLTPVYSSSSEKCWPQKLPVKDIAGCLKRSTPALRYPKLFLKSRCNENFH